MIFKKKGVAGLAVVSLMVDGGQKKTDRPGRADRRG